MMRARARLVESRAFCLVGCGLGLAVGAVVCAVVCAVGGLGLPCLPRAVFVFGAGVCVAVCCLCACAGVVLACWRVCVCAYSLPRLPCLRDLLPPGKIPGFSRPGSAGLLPPGGAVAVLPVGLACCRCWLPGVSAHVGGCVRLVPLGMPGGHLAGLLGLPPGLDRLPDALGKHGNFTEKFPGKTPTKNFFKKFPPMGERSAHEKNLQKRG